MPTKTDRRKRSAQEQPAQSNVDTVPTQRIDPNTTIPKIAPSPRPGNEFLGSSEESVITPSRLYYQKLTRFNPLRRLEPSTLSRHIDDFNNGYLREFALLMAAIAARDDVLSSVIPKRKASLKRLRWQVTINEDIPEGMEEEAEKHKAALFYFYNNLTASDASDANVKAGWPTFVDQMIDANAYKYAIHEIIWQPSPEGLTARFNKVPLWFFENRTGKLRFLATDFDPYGKELIENAWLITVGAGLMEPCAVAYMFKNLCMKDWLMYCEKHGSPGIHGETNAPYKSPQWQALEAAVAEIAANFSCVTAAGDKINNLDFSAQGQLPYQPLVQRMDEAMMWIWRGGSMSTSGSKANTPEQNGVTLQSDEEYKLTCDDGLLITETLNTQIDPFVIAWHFGQNVKPLAYVKVAPPSVKDTTKDIELFNFLIQNGIDIGKRQLAEHFNVPEMDEEDERAENPLTAAYIAEQENPTAGAPAEPTTSTGTQAEDEDEEDIAANIRRLEAEVEAANASLDIETDAALIESGIALMAETTEAALRPLAERLEAILDMPNEQATRAALAKLRDDMPDILAEINADPLNAEALSEVMSAAWFNGLLGATANRY